MNKESRENLLESGLHLLVSEQRERAHEVADEHEVALHLEEERERVVEVRALWTQIVVCRPLVLANGAAFKSSFSQRQADAQLFTILSGLPKLPRFFGKNRSRFRPI